MDLNEKTDYYNKVLARFSMRAGVLKAVDVELIREAYKNNSRDGIYSFACQKGILPFIAKLCLDQNLDRQYWADIYVSFEKRNTKILDTLSAIFDVFNEKGLKKIFLYENFGALLASGTSIGCFASGDVDLFAHSSLKTEISNVMISKGFLPHSTNIVKTEYYNEHLLKEGFRINVMWQPLARMKLPFHIDVNNSIKWDALDTHNNTNIQLPNKDALMYLCLLHTSVHSYHRSPDIRLYYDTDRLAQFDLNWESILEYARLDKTEVRVLTSAILSNRLLGSTIGNEFTIKKYKKKYWNIALIERRVFDSESHYLRKSPSGISVLFVEILSSDDNWLVSIFRILFPSKNWINEHYPQNKGKVYKGFLLHWKSLLS